ncbi:ETS-related transcription factor Elf-3 [Amia ocellicauda]|uniref:ETS-related transcription factor Elf-3 n=1 Tax=Amia ocellicauda TaxID=2972642 RepID=UPI003464326E|nr:ELF3 factor [Amia calva]
MSTYELSSILTNVNNTVYQTADPPAGCMALPDSKEALQPLTHDSLPAELLGPCKWYNTHPQFWSRQNVLEWISYHVEETKFDASTLNVAYCAMEGPVLCQLSRNTMGSMFGLLGDRLYQNLQELKVKFGEDMSSDMLNSLFADVTELLAEDTYSILDTVVLAPGVWDTQDGLKVEAPAWIDPGYESGPTSPDSLDSSNAGMLSYPTPSSPDSDGSDSDLEFSDLRFRASSDGFMKTERGDMKPCKRGRGRPRKLSQGMEHCMESKKSKHAPRGTHLWEFIRDILIHPELNHGLMKWEDRREGVFKFLKSEAVAQLWGQKKKNSSMTYEKLSRAMRYYYKREILERVDGRRLVYKFGKNSSGWRLEEAGAGM